MSKKNDIKIFKLAYPVIAPDGAEIRELQLRRLKGKEIKRVDVDPADGKFGAIFKFVAEMNNLPVSVMDELDGGDVFELVAEVAPFLGRGPGAMPSS